ncbi:MAG: hypothetical protein ACRD6X_18860 [Pyrinomonadaceae bacterium]
MTTAVENSSTATGSSGRPMLRINRLNHVRLNAKILDGTDQKLKQYLEFAGRQLDTEITNDDVIEYALNMLFDRDAAFKSWLKRTA